MIDDQETCELDCYKRADKIPKIVLNISGRTQFLQLVFDILLTYFNIWSTILNGRNLRQGLTMKTKEQKNRKKKPKIQGGLV